MSELNVSGPKGVLRRGWSAAVGDYAIAGGWSLRGEALMVGDAAGAVYAFDGKSGATPWARRGVHEGGVLAVAIHPSGSAFATAGQDSRVLIWSASEGQVSRAIDVGSGWVENLAWSPDGQWLAASCSRQVRAYGEHGAEVWRSDDHPSTVSSIAWSSVGELATACYGRVTFFDASTGELRQKLEWKGSLVSMVLSSDGDIVACGSQDNSVHFWRRSTEQDSMMSGYPAKPSALAFDDTGTLLATGGGRRGGDGLELPGKWSRRHAARRSRASCSTRYDACLRSPRDAPGIGRPRWCRCCVVASERWRRRPDRARGCGGRSGRTVLAARRARTCRARRAGWRDGLADRMNKSPNCPPTRRSTPQ